MTNKITKPVTFQIEPSGDCGECTSRIVMPRHTFCMAFGEEIRNQCQRQACKDYLAEIKNRVYCDGCKHLIDCGDWKECKIWDNHPEMDDDCNYYLNNCKDRQQAYSTTRTKAIAGQQYAINGKQYTAENTIDGCLGCAFEKAESCGDAPLCSGAENSVIFREVCTISKIESQIEKHGFAFIPHFMYLEIEKELEKGYICIMQPHYRCDGKLSQNPNWKIFREVE